VTLIKGGEGPIVGTMDQAICRSIGLKTSQKSIGPGVQPYVRDTDQGNGNRGWMRIWETCQHTGDRRLVCQQRFSRESGI